MFQRRFGGGGNDLLPWKQDLDAFVPVAVTNWANVIVTATQLYGGYNQSSGAQNAEMNWDVVISAGTWSFTAIYGKTTNSGIMSIQIDGVEVGTIDAYAAGAASNVVTTVAGITVATAGKHRIKIKMATKNASSTSYFCLLNRAVLQRTA